MGTIIIPDGYKSQLSLYDTQVGIKTVKDFFVKHGIAAERMTTAGMTRNEIKRAAAAALDTKSTFSNIKVELIITGKTTDQK